MIVVDIQKYGTLLVPTQRHVTQWGMKWLKLALSVRYFQFNLHYVWPFTHLEKDYASTVYYIPVCVCGLHYIV